MTRREGSLGFETISVAKYSFLSIMMQNIVVYLHTKECIWVIKKEKRQRDYSGPLLPVSATLTCSPNGLVQYTDLGGPCTASDVFLIIGPKRQ